MPQVRALVVVAGLLGGLACAGPRPDSGATPTAASAAPGDERSSAEPHSLGTADAAPPEPGETPRPSTLEQLMTRVSARLTGVPRQVAGYSLDGRPLPLLVLGDGPDTLLLLATIHGDEAGGTALLERLAEHLRATPELLVGRRVVLLPVVNPDGLAADRRGNARHVDLNRNFPASNRREHRRAGEQALSEPESRALVEVLERFAPTRVVSIHGWIGLVDWDGPARDLAQAMASACDLPARRIGSRPGSLGSHLGVDQQLPVITLELPVSARRADEELLLARFGAALLVAVAWDGGA